MNLLNRSHHEAVRVLRSVIGTGTLLVRRNTPKVSAPQYKSYLPLTPPSSLPPFPVSQPSNTTLDTPLRPMQDDIIHQEAIQLLIDDSAPVRSSPVIKPKFHIPPPPPPPDQPSTPLERRDPEVKGQQAVEDAPVAPLPPNTPPPNLPEGEEPAPPLPEGPPPVVSTVHPEESEAEEDDDLESLSPSEGSDGFPSVSMATARNSQLLDDSTEDPPPLPATPPPPLGDADTLRTSSEESLTPQHV